MVMIQWPNMVLIAGMGRNVGKTSLACHIIKHQSRLTNVIAIKITPHFHESCDTCKTIYSEQGLLITEELDENTQKDSSKMLKAGAKVYYVQSDKEKLSKVVEVLKPLIASNIPVVCESAALRNLIKPGLFLVLSKSSQRFVKNQELLNWEHFRINNFDFTNYHFIFEQNSWFVSHFSGTRNQ